MSDLPQNWAEVSFMDILDIQGGTQPPKKEFLYEPKDSYVRLLQIRDFGEKPFATYVKIKSSLKTVVEEDVLIARYGASIGRICTGMKGAYNVALSKVIIPEQIYKRFIFYLLKSSHFQNPILQTQRSAQDGFNKDDLQEITLPIPPLNEQKRIVEKLEKLLGKVEAVGARLDKIPVILKRFRQAVLAAACSGKLTADWREHKKINLETDLPFGWKIETVGNVIKDLKYGTSQKCDFEMKGVPVLRIPNIGDWLVDQADLKFAELPEREFNQLKLSEGDLLLIRSNGSVSLVGKTAIVRKPEENYAYAGYLIRLRPDKELIFPQFFNYVLASYDVRLQIEIPARSTSGVNNINSTEVKALKIPLPPIGEQKEIVRRIEDLFKFADQIEARLQRARSYTDKLTQSILAKAFRGELVPQDDADEPASVLLKRIREEKEQNSKNSEKVSTRKSKNRGKSEQQKLFANG